MGSFYPEFYLRANYCVHNFRDTLFDNYVQAKRLVVDVEKAKDIEDINELQRKSIELFKFSINSVIYSIMIVEAFLNDYLAVVLGDEEYYSKYDFLSVENKLNLCFDFIFKKKLRKDQGIIQLLSKINKIRNSYVHSKSRSVDLCEYDMSMEECEIDEQDIEMMIYELKKEIKQEYANIKDSIELIRELANEFDANDDNVKAKSRLFGNFIERQIKNSAISQVIADFKVGL